MACGDFKSTALLHCARTTWNSLRKFRYFQQIYGLAVKSGVFFKTEIILMSRSVGTKDTEPNCLGTNNFILTANVLCRFCAQSNRIPIQISVWLVCHRQCYDCHLFNCNETSLNCRHHQIILHPSQPQSGQYNVRATSVRI